MLSDTKENIIQKIKKAKTDPYPLPESIEEANSRPEALNLLTIYAALDNSDTEKIISNYAGKEFSQFKNDLGELASSKISPISLEINKLMDDKNYLESIIDSGKEKALAVAEPVLEKVYEITGFLTK